jgi:purine nucleoside phosphorylase
MKVVVSPRASQERGGAASVAEALAGADGVVISLAQVGVRTLKRPLSAAEVALMREALAGEERVVGYVCEGARLPDVEAGGPLRVVAVSDHVNLTWRSPLTGPNDARVGPRFPGMTDIYRPEVVLDRLGATGGIIVETGVLAGVRDDGCLTPYEAEVARAPGYLAVSEELVPVVIVAAHMGLRVAAAVVMSGS